MYSGCSSILIAFLWVVVGSCAFASEAIMREHCAKCHNDDKAKGDFNLGFLGEIPTDENLDYWLEALDLVVAGEMPPEGGGEFSVSDRNELIAYLKMTLDQFESASAGPRESTLRRLNNREFANGVRDVLLLRDIRTIEPTDNLIGDALYHGFDTHAETLGFSRFHHEQYIESIRKIVDATILSGKRPEARRYEIGANGIRRERLGQSTTRKIQHSKDGYFTFLDPLQAAYFDDFKTAPETGYYKIRIMCGARDRLVYDTADTGIYAGDPIKLSVHIGDRVRTISLPDEKAGSFELNEWIAAGSKLELRYPTDGLTTYGNGNFKFQLRIVEGHLKANNPKLYNKLLKKTKKSKSSNAIWMEHWQGPRPCLFNAEIEGPFYESWPPRRQQALLGKNPSVEKAAEILTPIAERAWRRSIQHGELDRIIALVESQAQTMGDIEALKEGVVAVLASPAFLFMNTLHADPDDRFAAKLSYFLDSTIPSRSLRESVRSGRLDSFDEVLAFVQNEFGDTKANAFMRSFPYAWLNLNEINFMAPDPDEYRFYHRKKVSEDMINEVLLFFYYITSKNLPITEFLAANYTFINADLAKIYKVKNVPPDSQFRKIVFKNGRRGGLLGMGAFLTATADSVSTSPIHRAVFVMENFMGIQPTPPPPDVRITEPDVRQAKTIKEILAAHTSDESCASCHKGIDPWGYAFENYDPTGAWRDEYFIRTVQSGGTQKKKKKGVRKRVPVDSSAVFRNGDQYKDIIQFRELLETDPYQKRFIRCFITKLLTYANGVEPHAADFAELDKLVSQSEEYGYRIVDTIAAVIHSPLFREE